MGPIISYLSHDISDKEIILWIWDFLICHSLIKNDSKLHIEVIIAELLVHIIKGKGLYYDK